jgi:hypothetical protein
LYIVDWEKLVEQFQQSGDPFEDDVFGSHEEVTLDYDSFRAQMDCLDQFEAAEDGEALNPETAAKVRELVNVLFWSWAGDDAKQVNEFPIENEQIDTALRPETVKRLATLWQSIPFADLAPIDEEGEAYTGVEYLATYGNALVKAAATGQGFVVLVF